MTVGTPSWTRGSGGGDTRRREGCERRKAHGANWRRDRRLLERPYRRPATAPDPVASPDVAIAESARRIPLERPPIGAAGKTLREVFGFEGFIVPSRTAVCSGKRTIRIA